jgi:hypothetical protein
MCGLVGTIYFTICWGLFLALPEQTSRQLIGASIMHVPVWYANQETSLALIAMLGGTYGICCFQYLWYGRAVEEVDRSRKEQALASRRGAGLDPYARYPGVAAGGVVDLDLQGIHSLSSD